MGGAILADINGDGRPDLVSWRESPVSEGKEKFQVALGLAGGGFGAPSTYQVSTFVTGIVAADSNSDGFQDLYVNQAVAIGIPCVELWLGHADGKLTQATNTGDSECSFAIPNGATFDIAIGDLNGDGIMDLVQFGMALPGTPDALRVFLVDANGTINVGTLYAANRGIYDVVIQDWNGDGAPDLVALGGSLAVYLNKGNGTFGDEMDCGVAAFSPRVIADFNRDGHPDVAFCMTGGVGILLGMGECQFQPMAEYPLTGGVYSLVHVDLNGDGPEDLVVRTADDSIILLLGGGDGTFQVAPGPLSSGSAPGGIRVLLVGDVTGDGKSDIVTIAGGPGNTIQVLGPTQILENTCP
jgi:hypothetical protein